MIRSVVILAVLGVSVAYASIQAPFEFRADSNQTTTVGTTTTIGATTQRTTTSQPCVPFKACWSKADCGEGACNGFNIGKCQCKCFNFIRCSSDDQCGGFRGACVNGQCDCDKAFREHGFDSRFTATQQFCNQKTCTQNGNECFGMPCTQGACLCPINLRAPPANNL